MPIGPRAKGVLASSTVDDIEESLLEAMESDPRLASGAAVKRADNVLDFIQMTGLTTGRVPEASAAAAVERVDDPISFYEVGVRDVDGTGDPLQQAYPELDSDAFHIDTETLVPRESESVSELKKIIAELASIEMEVASSPAPAPERPAAPAIVAADAPLPMPDVDELTVESQPAPVVDEPTPVIEHPHYESPMRSPAGLAAARDLLQELARANQAAEQAELAFARSVSKQEVRIPPDPARADEVLPTETVAPVETEFEPDATDHTTHHGLVKRRSGLPWRTWLLRLLVFAVAGGAGYAFFTLYERAAQPPRAAFANASQLIDHGRYEEASAAFVDFMDRFPEDARRADALFMAGYALQLVPDEPAPRAKEAHTEAANLLQRFIEEYPSHTDTPRAETLLGITYYRTGRYLEAINILGAPDRQYRDVGGYLPGLRTLGRAYAAISQVDNARNAFMRAAAQEDNMQPDQDYAELAGIYTNFAERSGDPAQRRRYYQLAVEQWDFALQVPGLLKSRKDDMKLLRDIVANKPETELNVKAGTDARGTRFRVAPPTGEQTPAGTGQAVPLQ